MSFASPAFLLALLLVPLAAYAWWQRRQHGRRYAVRYPAVATVKAAVGRTPAWRPLVPMVLLLASLAALVLALAKPQRSVAVPIESATIMLVTDHSRSMEADDVRPDRLAAAQKAANAFLDEVPDEVRVGIVTYSFGPDAIQTPTTDHEAVRRLVDQQFPDGGTGTGDALAAALEAINAEARRGDGKKPPAAIVLLSDGKTTVGQDPVGVALAAGQAKVPIYTISVGTDEGIVTGPGFGGYIPVPPDPETLGAIAEESGGKAYTAEDSERLSEIYKALGSRLATRKQKREATALFASAGLLLLLGAAAASVRLRPALP
jgi:Ca-activated chloride channel family protein